MGGSWNFREDSGIGEDCGNTMGRSEGTTGGFGYNGRTLGVQWDDFGIVEDSGI